MTTRKQARVNYLFIFGLMSASGLQEVQPVLHLRFEFLRDRRDGVETACLLCRIKQQRPPLCTQRRNSLQLTLERRM